MLHFLLGRNEGGLTKVRWLFESLSNEMDLPISDDWFATGLFAERESKAPTSRQQDLRRLTELFVNWANDGELFTGIDREAVEDSPAARAWA